MGAWSDTRDGSQPALLPTISAKHANVELVFAAWPDALRRHDLQALADRLDPKVVWQGLRPDLICHDREEVLETVAAQPDLPAVEALELLAVGEDRVVLGIHSPDLTEVAGEPLPGQVWEVFTIGDGRIVAIDEFRTRDEALRHAGR